MVEKPSYDQLEDQLKQLSKKLQSTEADLLRSNNSGEKLQQKLQQDYALQLSEKENKYQDLFNNVNVSIWNEDCSEIFDALQQFRAQGITNFKKYLSDAPEQLVWDLVSKVKVLKVNHATLKLFAAENEEHFFSNISNIFADGALQVFTDELCAIWNKESHFSSEVNYITLDNKKLKAIISFKIPDNREDFKNIPVTIQDITEHKQIEAQLRQAQKMEAMGILTGGIAHEFNNLLSPILGYADLLLSNRTPADAEFNSLHQILTAGERAKVLVQQLLAYSRQSMSRKKPVQLEVILKEAIMLIKNTIPANITIKKNIKQPLPPIMGMPNEIHQIIFNLCINASHAMVDGGDLNLTLQRKEPQNNCESQQHIAGYICLTVEDTGTGIEEHTLERIFDPFFTTKDIGAGSGLGLSVVEGIVEQHQGVIEVESKPATGTSFHIYFPIAEQEGEYTENIQNPIVPGVERILVVDDERMVLDLAKKMLERLDYKVTGFVEPELALTHFAEHPEQFDLVITDYGMPNMNGKQLAENIKLLRPDIPIILCTGYGDLLIKEKIENWGMENMLMKPFALREISTIVRNVLNKLPE